MQESLISVIVPIYRVEPYLKRCVDSIRTQSYSKLEIILVDDGSTDACPEICDEYASIDNRIQVIHKTNAGVSAARNAGLHIASGKYIAFVDADDWIEPDMIKILITAMVSCEAQLVSCDLFHDSYDDTEVRNYSEYNENASITEISHPYRDILLIPQIAGYLCNKLFVKKLIVHELDNNLKQNEDLLFVVQYLHAVSRMVHINRKLYHYRRRAPKLDLSLNSRVLSLMDSYERILECYKEEKPELSWIPRRNLLKIFLNIRARYKINTITDAELKKRLYDGIKKNFKSVLFCRNVLLKDKLNIFFTFLFPRSMLQAKNRILQKNRLNGKWTE